MRPIACSTAGDAVADRDPSRQDAGMIPVNRRQLLLGGAAAGVVAGCSSSPSRPAPGATTSLRPQPPVLRTLTTRVQGTGSYAYLPFDVPVGVARVEVAVTADPPGAKLGAGLFDARGTAYQSPGFRGIYGEERNAFFVAADAASQSFLPGPMDSGRWTVVVPVFLAAQPTTVTARVTLSFGPTVPVAAPGPQVGVVLDRPGWYRGDLHCHTPESSDAWHSRTALDPAAWAAQGRLDGLDFAAMTDHNVISQNQNLARDAGSDMLLMAGEEMTNWFYGHATVSGIAPGQWLDFRQTPEGSALLPDGARIRDFLTAARRLGAYISAAHPSFGAIAWRFKPEMTRPDSRPDGYEVWTGPFQPDDEQSLRDWDAMLQQGWQVHANGGSDLHGTENNFGFRYGTPTTVVYANRLAQSDVIAALRAGRSFVMRRPDGVECYLTGTLGGSRTYVGGTLTGRRGDQAEIEALVRGGRGMRLILISGGRPVSTTPLTEDEQVVRAQVPVPGYVRAEVRGQNRPGPPGKPLALELDMECLTNPIWLQEGAPAAGGLDEVAAPGPAGPRRRA
jgi:hypothetical protein